MDETPSLFARLIDRLAAKAILAVPMLILVALAAFLPGFATLPPMDRDEARFAQATKQMLETGDFIDIRFQDEARHKKPVGIYWLQAASVATLEAAGVDRARAAIAAYRVPSLIGAVAAVLLTWWTALPLIGRRGALLAGLGLAATVLIGVEARLAKTDAMLLATILAMMGTLVRVWLSARRGGTAAPIAPALSILFWIALGLSILIKGPIGPMVVGLAIAVIVAVTRDWRWLAALRPGRGLIVTAVIVAPWLIAIAVKTGGTFFQDSIGGDMLAKVGQGQEEHGAPPGTYLAAFLGTAWPLAPFVLLAWPWLRANRREPAVLFLAAWVVPTWIVFELVATKLPHYVLPTYPALAIAAGAAIAAGMTARGRWGRVVMALVPALAIILPVAAIAAVIWFEGRVAWGVIPFGLLAGAAGLLAWSRHGRGFVADALGLAVAASLAAGLAVYQMAVPALPTLWPSPRLAEAVRAFDCPDRALATAGYREPSLVFLTGTELRMLDGDEAAAFLAEGSCRFAFIEARQEGAFRDAALALGLDPVLVERVGGLNLGNGRVVDIGVYRAP